MYKIFFLSWLIFKSTGTFIYLFFMLPEIEETYKIFFLRNKHIHKRGKMVKCIRFCIALLVCFYWKCSGLNPIPSLKMYLQKKIYRTRRYWRIRFVVYFDGVIDGWPKFAQ